MEREERTCDAAPAGGIAHAEDLIGLARRPDTAVPARLWREAMGRWISASHPLFLASLARSGREAPPPARAMTP